MYEQTPIDKDMETMGHAQVSSFHVYIQYIFSKRDVYVREVIKFETCIQGALV